MSLSVLGLLQNTLLWFQKAVPDPTDRNIQTQLGVHFEEVAEMVMEVSSDDFTTKHLLARAQNALHDLAVHLKTSPEGLVFIKPENRVGYLDAICDQIVTGTGCGHMSQLDVLNAMNAANESHFSKFDDTGEPIFTADRKVAKGPNFFKPDLTPFV
jgi:hypothetical protein